MLLLGITGRARAGKDTFGKYLVANHGFEHAYYAKALKDMLGALGFAETHYQTTEQKEAVIPDLGRSYRYLAQTLGTEWGRQLIHSDIWLLIMQRRWKTLCANKWAAGFEPRMVITDVRFDNEADWVRKQGGTVVHLSSGADRSGMTAETAAHKSEAGVQFVTGDRLVFNVYTSPSEESLKVLNRSAEMLVNNLLAEPVPCPQAGDPL